MTTPPDVAERMRRLRYDEGLSTVRIARLLGCSPGTVRRYAPGPRRAVPAGPFLDYVKDLDQTALSKNLQRRMRTVRTSGRISVHAADKILTELGSEHMTSILFEVNPPGAGSSESGVPDP